MSEFKARPVRLGTGFVLAMVGRVVLALQVPRVVSFPVRQAVSHGCVRVSNAAALVLERLTRAGTPLRIVA